MTKYGQAPRFHNNGWLDTLEFVAAWAAVGATFMSIWVGVTAIDMAQMGMLWLILTHLWR